jgi:hypothetical protein
MRMRLEMANWGKFPSQPLLLWVILIFLLDGIMFNIHPIYLNLIWDEGREFFRNLRAFQTEFV